MIYSYCRVKKCSNKTTVLAGHRKERRTMASVRDAEETLNLALKVLYYIGARNFTPIQEL